MHLSPLKITDERDGELLPRSYSYWSQAVVIDGVIYVFVGHADGRPRFFRIDPRTREVVRLGALISGGE